MKLLACVDAHRIRLGVVQELQHVEVEAGPDCFAVLLAADDFLDGGVGPDFPEVVALVGLEVAEADLQGGRVPLPTVGDLFLKFIEPFLGHGSLRSLTPSSPRKSTPPCRRPAAAGSSAADRNSGAGNRSGPSPSASV